MNVLNLEHFLFSSDIIYITDNDQIPMKILFSMASIYIYAHDPRKLFNKETNQALTQMAPQSTERSNLVSNNSSTSQINRVNIINKAKTFEDCLIILTDYDIDNVIVEYFLLVQRKPNTKKENQNYKKEIPKYPIYYNQSHKFKFKYSSQKEKNFIKIMIIIEGYKYAINHSLLSLPINDETLISETSSSRAKNLANKDEHANNRI